MPIGLVPEYPWILFNTRGRGECTSRRMKMKWIVHDLMSMEKIIRPKSTFSNYIGNQLFKSLKVIRETK